MAQKNAELTTTLKESQLRTEAMAAAAEELYGKHITVCRYACALEEKVASLETSSEASAMKMQQQLVQMHSRHIEELGVKERYFLFIYIKYREWSRHRLIITQGTLGIENSSRQRGSKYRTDCRAAIIGFAGMHPLSYKKYISAIEKSKSTANVEIYAEYAGRKVERIWGSKSSARNGES
jgi:hypothetical protein